MVVKQTHCKNGHLRTPENLYPTGGKGSFACRQCKRDQAKDRREKALLVPIEERVPPRSHCSRGHVFSIENTLWLPGSLSPRCRRCARAKQQRYHGRPVAPDHAPLQIAYAKVTRCRQGHPYDETNTRWHGKHRRCRTCERWKWLKKKYNLTPAEWDRLVIEQEGRCAVCSSPANGNLFVDHEHGTGRVRGLLCSPCNLAVGHMQDNSTRLRAAPDYVDLHDASRS